MPEHPLPRVALLLDPSLQPGPPEAAPRAGLSQAGTRPQGAASSPHCLLEWTALSSTQGQNTQDRAGKSGGQGGRSRAPERQEFKTFAHLLQEGKKGLSRQQAQRRSSEVAAVQVSNFKERKRWPGFLTVSLSQSQANFRLPCGQVTHPRSPSSRICAQGDAKDTSTPSHPIQAWQGFSLYC